MRIIQTLREGSHVAKVYRSVESNEYVVRVLPNGVLRSKADCFETDKESALDTARAQLGWCVSRFGQNGVVFS